MGIVNTDRHEEVQPGSDAASYVFYGKPHEVWGRQWCGRGKRGGWVLWGLEQENAPCSHSVCS